MIQSPWLNVKPGFFISLRRFAEENRLNAVDVVIQALRAIESANYIHAGELPTPPKGEFDDVLPVWFIVPIEFWSRLDRLASKTNQSPERLIEQGLDIVLRRKSFAVIAPTDN